MTTGIILIQYIRELDDEADEQQTLDCLELHEVQPCKRRSILILPLKISPLLRLSNHLKPISSQELYMSMFI